MNDIRPVFLKLAFTASMLLSASIAFTPATAATITYSFSGAVDRVQPQLSSTFNTTQPMSGFMTVNTGVISPTHPGIGTYTITNFSLDIGTYHASSTEPNNQVIITDRISGLDRLNVTVNNPSGAPVPNPIHPSILYSPLGFDIQLRGPAGSTFSSDALPTTVPSISSVFTNFNQWRLIFTEGRVVGGTMTAALTAVPLPAAVILFGAGLVALVGLGAGSWRQKKNTIA